MSTTWAVIGAVGIAVQLVLLTLLLRGAYRKYSILLLIYFGFEPVKAAVQFGLVLGEGTGSEAYFWTYWGGGAVTMLLLFLLMIAFTYQALEGDPKRAIVSRWLGLAVLAVIGVFLFVARGTIGTSVWFTSLIRTLNFAAALMNLVLWTALLRTGQRDKQFLLLSAGLGIKVTGEAIGHSIRLLLRLSGDWLLLPNIFLIATHFLCLGVWYKALQIKPAAQPTAVRFDPTPRSE
jgi:hypothetical protein